MTSFDQRQQNVGTQYNAGEDIIVAGRDVHVHNQAPPRLSRSDQYAGENRRRMLARVRAEVESWLNGSLEGAALLALRLEHRSNAVPERWRMLVQERGQVTAQPGSTRSVVEVFDQFDGELLILGEPGAGKTMTLLALARTLIGRAEQEDALPVPVVLQLASWASKRGPLAEWLAQELTLRYGVSMKIARSWVEGELILPLLDGLDEVAAEHRTACVAAINAYRASHKRSLASVVVCCRAADYEALPKLDLRGAVVIRPLDSAEVDAYVAAAGQQLAGLQAALKQDAELRETATRPLALNLMVLAYQGVPSDALPTTGTAEERRAHLLESYVTRMFERRGVNPRYPRVRVLHWLSWLARGLARRSETVFYLDRLQPDWLATRAARRWYTLIDRVGWGVIIGAAYALAWGLVHGPAGGLAYGLVYGLAVGLLGGKHNSRADEHLGSRHVGPGLVNAGQGILIVLAGGLANGLAKGAVYGQAVGLAYGAILVSVLAGSIGLLSTLTGGLDVRPRWISPVETLHWSLLKTTRSVLIGLAVGLAVGLAFGLTVGAVFEDALGLSFGLAFGLAFGLVGGLVGGLVTGQIETRSSPNQGILRSLRGAILIASLVTLAYGLAGGLAAAGQPAGLADRQPAGLAAGLPAGLAVGLAVGLAFGLAYGLTFGLVYGGYACLSHASLRLVLRWSGAMPLRYVSFLDYATERIFLRRVGGGYTFVHRLVQEHFAAMELD